MPARRVSGAALLPLARAIGRYGVCRLSANLAARFHGAAFTENNTCCRSNAHEDEDSPRPPHARAQGPLLGGKIDYQGAAQDDQGGYERRSARRPGKPPARNRAANHAARTDFRKTGTASARHEV